jgi:primosomal replication protein N
VRYTPSGVALVDCVLHHVSELLEAGQMRRVEVEAPALAFDAVARRLDASPLDAVYRFRGFVANKSRNSKRTVFHITDFDPADLERRVAESHS